MAGKSRSRWPRVWWLALCFALFFSGFPAAAIEKTPESWPQSTLPLSPILSGSTVRMGLLLTRLSERKAQIENLKEALRELSQQAEASALHFSELSAVLQEAVNSRDKLAMELTEISSSRERLQTDYVALRLSFGSYQAEAGGQIRRLTRQKNWWRLGGIAGILGGLAALVWGLLK